MACLWGYPLGISHDSTMGLPRQGDFPIFFDFSVLYNGVTLILCIFTSMASVHCQQLPVFYIFVLSPFFCDLTGFCLGCYPYIPRSFDGPYTRNFAKNRVTPFSPLYPLRRNALRLSSVYRNWHIFPSSPDPGLDCLWKTLWNVYTYAPTLCGCLSLWGVFSRSAPRLLFRGCLPLSPSLSCSAPRSDPLRPSPGLLWGGVGERVI